jgi:hypothetical protein
VAREVAVGTAKERHKLTYEQKLDGNLSWALDEGSRHFEEKSEVHAALHDFAVRLDALCLGAMFLAGTAGDIVRISAMDTMVPWSFVGIEVFTAFISLLKP